MARLCWKVIEDVNAIYFLVLLDLGCLRLLHQSFFLQSNFYILIRNIGVGRLRENLRSELSAYGLHKFRVFLLFISQRLGINVDTFFLSEFHYCTSLDMGDRFVILRINFGEYFFSSLLLALAVQEHIERFALRESR